MFAAGYATEADIEKIEQKVMDEVLDSVVFAEESPYPDPAEAYSDVYVQADYPYIME
jgi:pyruvate dehydrogenase E1 component alpha subunit